ncbi:MAG: hypothetical protein R2709_14795 [Marmoricola sp.]
MITPTRLHFRRDSGQLLSGQQQAVRLGDEAVAELFELAIRSPSCRRPTVEEAAVTPHNDEAVVLVAQG